VAYKFIWIHTTVTSGVKSLHLRPITRLVRCSDGRKIWVVLWRVKRLDCLFQHSTDYIEMLNSRKTVEHYYIVMQLRIIIFDNPVVGQKGTWHIIFLFHGVSR
jgi:hypothetical protein